MFSQQELSNVVSEVDADAYDNKVINDYSRRDGSLKTLPSQRKKREAILRLTDHLKSDELLLFASDFPHWQYEGDQMLPLGIAPGLRQKILIDNPVATYSRLARSV